MVWEDREGLWLFCPLNTPRIISSVSVTRTDGYPADFYEPLNFPSFKPEVACVPVTLPASDLEHHVHIALAQPEYVEPIKAETQGGWPAVWKTF